MRFHAGLAKPEDPSLDRINFNRFRGALSWHPQGRSEWSLARSAWARDFWRGAAGRLTKPTRQTLRRRLFQARCEEFAKLFGGEPRRLRREMALARAKQDYRHLGRSQAI